MNILLVNYEFPPAGGGAGRALDQISLQLAADGRYSPHLLVGLDHSQSLPECRVRRMLPVRVGRVSRHETGLRAMLEFLIKAALGLRFICRRHDIRLICYFFSLPTGLLSFIQPRSIPYIVSLRGGDVPGYNGSEFALLHRLLLPLNRAVVRRSAQVIALSDDLRRAAAAALGATRGSLTIYNGSNFKPIEASPATGERGFLDIICVSRLVSWKRIDLLIQAIKPLPYARLTVIGDGSERDTLDALATRLGLADRIQFTGPLNHSELRNRMLAADVFCLPSVGDSFGQVYVEAMSCGLPVIAARAGGVPEIVVHGRCGILVEPNDLEALSAAIARLHDDAELRLSIARHNPEYVAENFSWRHTAAQYSHAIDQALGQ